MMVVFGLYLVVIVRGIVINGVVKVREAGKYFVMYIDMFFSFVDF